MVMMEEMRRLGNDEFIRQYGEQSFQQLQALSAQERFNEAMVKLQSFIGDLALDLQPFTDMLGKALTNTKALYGIMGLMLGLSFSKMIYSLVQVAATLASAGISAVTIQTALTAGAFALALPALLGVAYGAYKTIQNDAEQDVAQDFIMQDGKIQKFRKDDLIIGGTSLMSESSYSNNTNNSKIEALLEQLVAKNTNVYMDSSQVGYAEAFSYSKL